MLSFSRAGWLWVVLCPCVLWCGVIFAQQSPLRLNGTVEDPTGARVPHAAVSADGNGLHFVARTGRDGSFSLPVPPADYEVRVDAPGFGPLTISVPRQQVEAGAPLSIRLSVATRRETVDVGQAESMSSAADENLNSVVLGGDDLLALSSDQSTFQKELLAEAGALGGTAQIYVDGFSNGKVPPKIAIQSVRVNRDPFSAQYDTLGLGRLEVETKAGGDKLHGAVALSGSEQALNSANPFAPKPQPGYYILDLDGNLSGPLDHKSTFYLSGLYDDQQNNTAVNALLPSLYSEAVQDPQTISGASLRLDRQFSDKNQIKFRYQFDRSTMQNGGVGLLVLPSQGYANATDTNTFQFTQSYVPNSHTVNQLRVQYVHATIDQHPEETASGVCSSPLTASCSVFVEGAFSGGGDPTQVFNDARDSVEAEDILSRDWKQHFLRVGGRFRFMRDANSSTAGFNGQFIFPSLAQYTAGQPSQFSVTSGTPQATVTLEDVAAYAQDEWKVTPHFTLDMGFRFESQTGIPDHANPAPRIGLAYAPMRRKAKTPVVVLRAGYGIFYDRFLIDNLITAAHENGVNQQIGYVTDPATLAQLYANGFSGANLPATQPQIYRVDPNLRTSYNLSQTYSAERRLGKYGTVAGTYIVVRGVHQYESINANAPNPVTGVRPLGTNLNLYEYTSRGIEKDQLGYLNLRLNPTARLRWLTQYVVSAHNSSGQGASTFASNSYNVSQDYGRLPSSQRQQLFSFLSATLPRGFTLTGIVTAQSGLPFNITTGADNNGDTVYNDRPSFATSASPAGLVVATKYGSLDLTPQPGERVVPINYGTGPALVWTSASLSKSFDVGGHLTAGTKAVPAHREGGAQVGFTVEADNLTNHANAAPLDGVLRSPLFGRPLAQWSGLSLTTAGSRIVFLRMNLSF